MNENTDLFTPSPERHGIAAEMSGLKQEIAKIMCQAQKKDHLIEVRQRRFEREVRLSEIMGILSHHVGKARAIGMGELYTKIYKKEWRHRINDTRDLRQDITDMRDAGRRICATADAVGGGYYLPASDSEWDAFRGREIGQAARRIKRIRNMYRISIEETMRQVQIVLEGAK
jgi:hypothetical protein